MTDRNRMKALVEQLNKASKTYYQEDREILSNQEYDALYDELAALEKKTGTILANSPTQKVGYTVLSNLVKVRHESPILSLDKTKETAKLESFLEEKEGILSWKLDGLTIVLKYRNGTLEQAITRGNGEVGEDVTYGPCVQKYSAFHPLFGGIDTAGGRGHSLQRISADQRGIGRRGDL